LRKGCRAGGQAEKDAVRRETAFVVRAVDRGEVDDEVLDAALHEQLGRLA